MPVAQRELTFTTDDRRRWTSGPVATEWWAEENGTPVAYMKTLTYPDERARGVRFLLCDIEVRDGYRGQGLARAIIAHAEATTGFTLYTSGHYTPLGAAALQGRVPVVPGEEYDEGVRFRDMTFVHDWDNKIGPA